MSDFKLNYFLKIEKFSLNTKKKSIIICIPDGKMTGKILYDPELEGISAKDKLIKRSLEQLTRRFETMGFEIVTRPDVTVNFKEDEGFCRVVNRFNSSNLENSLLYSIYVKDANFLITENSELIKIAKELNLDKKVLKVLAAYDLFAVNNTVGRKFPKWNW
jgi:hypothetical protein